MAEIWMKAPERETQKAKRFRTNTVQTGYFGTFSQEDIDIIGECVEMLSIAFTDAMCAPMDVNGPDLRYISDMSYYAAMSSIKMLSERSAESDRTLLSQIIASTAVNGVIFGNSQLFDEKLSMLGRAKLQSLASLIIEKNAVLMLTQEPPEGQEAPLKDAYSRIEELESELANAQSELKSRSNDVEKLEKELSNLRQAMEENVEVKALQAELEAARRDLDHAEKTLESLHDKQDEKDRALKRAMAEANAERRKLKEQRELLAQEMAAPTSNTDAWRTIVDEHELMRFKSPADMLAACRTVFSGELSFGRKAEKDVANLQDGAEDLWDMLSILATRFLPTCREGRMMEGREFLEKTGFEMSSNEGKLTEENRRLQKMRQDTFRDKTVTATHHMKGRGGDFRVYFAYDADTKAIDIVRCGKHLETIGSKRKGF